MEDTWWRAQAEARLKLLRDGREKGRAIPKRKRGEQPALSGEAGYEVARLVLDEQLRRRSDRQPLSSVVAHVKALTGVSRNTILRRYVKLRTHISDDYKQTKKSLLEHPEYPAARVEHDSRELVCMLYNLTDDQLDRVLELDYQQVQTKKTRHQKQTKAETTRLKRTR